MTTSRTHILDPVSRATEILFGLIMVLTFTASLNANEASRSDVRLMLIAALGCNLAWGLIDAVMYLLSTRAEKALVSRMIGTVRHAPPALARREIAATLPAYVAASLDDDDIERIRQHLAGLPGQDTHPDASDLRAAAMVFGLVFFATLPVALPFLLVKDARLALWLSHAIAIASLFVAGRTLGRLWGRPWRVGLAMVAAGLILVGIALALGG